MTGLILKDLLYLKRTSKILLLLLVFYIVMSAVSSEESSSGTFAGAIVLLTTILSINAFAYDEASNWKLYEKSLPISASRIVLARYLLTFGFSSGLTLLFCLVNLIVAQSLSLIVSSTLWISWGIALLLCAILLPLMYRFGTQKARLAFVIAMLLPAAGILLISKMNLPQLNESIIRFGLKLIPLLCFVVYLLSYWISCRIYARKED